MCPVDAVHSPGGKFARMGPFLANDYRTRKSLDALNSVLDVPADAICISIGGGPGRAHDRLVNVNIGPFPNVEIVGDAHRLPYADGSVDAIHSEAVLEHLQDPASAAREMFRVMKPGGKAFVCTPFLQAYHGSPDHYQNFTISGHRKLFEAQGFEVIESGVCVGPVYAITTIIAMLFRSVLPRPLGFAAAAGMAVMRAALGPLDLVLSRHQGAHVAASSTYLVARK